MEVLFQIGNCKMRKYSNLIDRSVRAFWCVVALIIRYLIPIQRNRVICWAYGFQQYGCNPKYISEYILDREPAEFEIIWAFKKGADVKDVPKGIKIVYYNTFSFIWKLYSAKFVITNKRIERYLDYFFKKDSQIYIMTWHGTTPLKRIENDAVIELGHKYHIRAKYDSKICDLMLSNSSFFTKLIRNSFLYKGEILESGIPRNDLFFDQTRIELIRKKVFREYNVNENQKVVMYAPTFRNDNNFRHFVLNWKQIIPEIKKMMNSDVVLFIRLHPNSIEDFDVNAILEDDCMRNLCYYNDMQELLCVTDILITDYSSTMFEMAMLKKICILYADDLSTYDRKYYFNFKELPFPLAENEQQLIQIIKEFSVEEYLKKIKLFYNQVLKVHESGIASKSVVKWMIDKKRES